MSKSFKEDKVQVNVGGGFLSLLTVLFIGLKLTGYIDWSWWWVLAPLWIPLGFWLAVIVITMIFVAIMAYFEWLRGRKRK